MSNIIIFYIIYGLVCLGIGIIIGIVTKLWIYKHPNVLHFIFKQY